MNPQIKPVIRKAIGIGDTVTIIGVSAQSMELYTTLKGRGAKIYCPCNNSAGDSYTVIEVYKVGFLLRKTTDSSFITCAVNKDVKKW